MALTLLASRKSLPIAGSMQADEVVLLFVSPGPELRQRFSRQQALQAPADVPAVLPHRSLRAFQRVSLQPGQKQQVCFSLAQNDFSLATHGEPFTMPKASPVSLHRAANTLYDLPAENATTQTVLQGVWDIEVGGEKGTLLIPDLTESSARGHSMNGDVS